MRSKINIFPSKDVTYNSPNSSSPKLEKNNGSSNNNLFWESGSDSFKDQTLPDP